jgi:hypothetical protein
MAGCCVLCSAEAAATSPAANQQQHHLENVYISRKLGLISTYLQYILDQFWQKYISNEQFVAQLLCASFPAKGTYLKISTRFYYLTLRRGYVG